MGEEVDKVSEGTLSGRRKVWNPVKGWNILYDLSTFLSFIIRALSNDYICFNISTGVMSANNLQVFEFAYNHEPKR